MANICHAFSRIMPRYQYDVNTKVMVVEDLEHTLGRTQVIGNPPRYINAQTSDPRYHGHRCNRMDDCCHQTSPNAYPHRYCDGCGCGTPEGARRSPHQRY